jgi:hypothetical protein
LDEERVILTALGADGRGRGEGRCLSAVAFDEDPLGAPPIDLAHRYVLHLIVSIESLYNLRHCPSFPFPRIRQQNAQV